ncbi:respiratory chain complex I subunit 1 family protein [Sulfobacillus thermosulfidooxidans]|uniref:Formate hydrogenlyase subunit 4 n=1 Tax=Sulfobacillus thermosulfidooxidans (strain DSM 9293 / VKM B-1269 / AT-1) TaxID=929705 RepID=A0A1W1W7X9_SULTA|nr:NADH-quinone oxidoreductase subunit H [Sulfobacillus thermosulfidooxidans]OLZ10518.1 NADH dehydrogenase [Sulfobacillus thermosulfidooxidans]OLZ14226.1 NADH dehydrogenase [Sulfobacillus thermosulfidooxidans]OLZ18969.1 NADH dehydrogenase [Sulfobacillus thermosulfidooxidans]SMC02397.1 Formate hydrogenlyase subunit 4 [Sulfobacillus thermosulfidooxidans DSM 9293]
MVNEYVAQLIQVLFVLGFSPLLKGIMDRYKARLAGRYGPPIWQPYRDLRKWMHKETIRTTQTSWVSEWAPVFYFIAPLIVAMLIPVLTTFPLPFAWMGDMLAGGMILGGGGIALLFAALDSGSVYPVLGVSRIRLIATFTEPLALLLVFIAAQAAGATIPFVVNQTLGSPPWEFSPAHILIIVGWFLFLIAESGHIPVDNPSTAQELSMIDPGRTFESSGLDLMLYEWGGWMKFTVLTIILMNVLVSPFGLARSLAVSSLALAVFWVMVKLIFAAGVLITIEVSFAKLRLIRNVDFITAAIVLAIIGAVTAAWSLV